ncbi:uncharacterized protein LOC110992929 [Pieris rapae]|uniref:uncharacterized protein LOC110992929 n=1 Tax=Pieris rapae TaxID=64459 RepID=UPI001E280120|nr:uncharacterized protein LOC110992929 [Pieris rapae]
MELTQRLESTQQTFGNTSEVRCPDQIGFLGICGTKYPVLKGPNKIGRDPQTCSIVLNLNSISRQHAVLNVLNKNNFMLMDLDSANKTKLQDKTLDPYIPQVLQNGDTVQFGQVFGIFRLLEEETDLPMTQALEIPETPVIKKHLSKINHTTLIPESPEVSDRDDSFITPSQPQTVSKRSNYNFTKPSGKPILNQTGGLNGTDNVNWNSSKKSESFQFDSGLKNVQIVSVKSEDITSGYDESHTQITDESIVNNKNNVSIYDANTQLPCEDKMNYYNLTNETTAMNGHKDDHDLDTQIPDNCNDPYEYNASVFKANTKIPDDFYDMETQVHVADHLPNVCTIETSLHMEHDINKDVSIFNAETQQVFIEPKQENQTVNEKCKSHEASDDIILFDEISSQSLEDNMDSQAILPSSPNMNLNANNLSNLNVLDENIINPNIPEKVPNVDDFDNLPTQIITTKSTEINDDHIDDIDILPTQIVVIENNTTNVNPQEISSITDADEDITDCEDNLDQNHESLKDKDTKFEDLQTQIISEDLENGKPNDASNCNFEDMLTQVIVPEEDTTLKCKVLKQIITINDDFKVPKPSPRKVKRQMNLTEYLNKPNPLKNKPGISEDDDPNYYAATQDIIGDLCTQTDPKNSTKDLNDPGGETKIHEMVSGLSSQEVRDIVGVEKNSKLKRFPSDSSDCEATPSKPFKFLSTDLPNSQEIKSSITAQSRTITDVLSDSESEKESEEGTPILFKKKKKISEVKLDLLRKFSADELPSRISMRVKKPTDRILNSSKSVNENILKSHYIRDQEENIDADIVTENILRLKSEKTKKSADASKLNVTTEPEEIPKREKRITRIKTEEPTTSKETKIKRASKSKDDKVSDKIKVKIVKPTKRGRPKKDKAEEKPETIDDGGSITRQTRSCDSKVNPRGILKRRSSYNDISNEVKTEPIRRSQRRKCTKDGDESEVYSSSNNSPGLKRNAFTNVEIPAKKYRPATSLGLVTKLRSTSARKQKTHYVLFTAFPANEVKSQLESLGAVLVNDVKACTVVLTLQIKRTFKLLCAVGLGKPVVGRQWVQACIDNNVIVEPWYYLIQDEVSEQRFNFKLEQTLHSKRNFLKGLYISSTPSVMPNAQEMKLIVECSGGKWKEVSDPPKSKWLVVSTPVDKALWPAIKDKGGIIVSNELVLDGVLKQKLEIEQNRLG